MSESRVRYEACAFGDRVFVRPDNSRTRLVYGYVVRTCPHKDDDLDSGRASIVVADWFGGKHFVTLGHGEILETEWERNESDAERIERFGDRDQWFRISSRDHERNYKAPQWLRKVLSWLK